MPVVSDALLAMHGVLVTPTRANLWPGIIWTANLWPGITWTTVQPLTSHWLSVCDDILLTHPHTAHTHTHTLDSPSEEERGTLLLH